MNRDTNFEQDQLIAIDAAARRARQGSAYRETAAETAALERLRLRRVNAALAVHGLTPVAPIVEVMAPAVLAPTPSRAVTPSAAVAPPAVASSAPVLAQKRPTEPAPTNKPSAPAASTPRTALDVPCFVCNAGAGSPCTRHGMHKDVQFHAGRIEKFKSRRAVATVACPSCADAPKTKPCRDQDGKLFGRHGEGACLFRMEAYESATKPAAPKTSTEDDYYGALAHRLRRA